MRNPIQLLDDLRNRLPAVPLLSDITITRQLTARRSHRNDAEDEIAAMRRIANTMATDPDNTFRICVETALALCRADSCGISLRERSETGEDIFRWIALTGQLKEHLHGTTPRFDSPCGVCVDANTPILMRRPELVYKYLDVGPAFEDVLLIPLTEKGCELEGTIWIVAHNKQRKFDEENARVMHRIAVFTSTALHLARIGQRATAEASKHQLMFRELDHRVNNTLMMTAGMLRQRLGSITDPHVKAALKAASESIVTMGVVHQIGSRGNAGNLAEVIGSITAAIVPPDSAIQVDLHVDPIIVPGHKAAVVGLIVSELTINAVKHAFVDRPGGRIGVRLTRLESGTIALAVTDDGVPMSSKPGREGSLGLQLIDRLASQLGGQLTVTSDPKQFTISFLANDPSETHSNAG